MARSGALFGRFFPRLPRPNGFWNPLGKFFQSKKVGFTRWLNYFFALNPRKDSEVFLFPLQTIEWVLESQGFLCLFYGFELKQSS